MSIYVMVGITKRDEATYAEYVSKALPSLEKYGGEALVVTDTPRAIEGTNPCGRYVVLRFADQSAFETWYHSPEYQAARPLRHAAADTLFFVTAEGLA